MPNLISSWGIEQSLPPPPPTSPLLLHQHTLHQTTPASAPRPSSSLATLLPSLPPHPPPTPRIISHPSIPVSLHATICQSHEGFGRVAMVVGGRGTGHVDLLAVGERSGWKSGGGRSPCRRWCGVAWQKRIALQALWVQLGEMERKGREGKGREGGDVCVWVHGE